MLHYESKVVTIRHLVKKANPLWVPITFFGIVIFTGVDLNHGKYNIRIYMKGFPDPVYARWRYLNCDDLKDIPNLPCPLKKGGGYH